MNEYRVIDLTVDNHPGVMYRVTGLFSRRAVNIEGIFCRRLDGGAESRMFLLVREDGGTGKIVRQLCNLYDVKRADVHAEGTDVFVAVMDILAAKVPEMGREYPPDNGARENQGIDDIQFFGGEP